MENAPVIQIQHASVLFNGGTERVDSFKEYIVRLLKGKIRFTPFWALRDISLTVRHGEVVGFVGANGAGKSTLLKLIAGVLAPSEGRVETHGKIAPLIELGAGFDGNLTARENVFLNGAFLGYSCREMKRCYDDIITFAELKDFQDLPVKNFSSGMTARLGFAIAIAHTPDILVVDEALSVGDFRFQEKCKARLSGMIAQGVTVLFVSHSAAAVQSLCSRVVWLKDGQIAAEGAAKTVLAAYRTAGGA